MAAAQLAPGSDIDLLFVRPFKQTRLGRERHRVHPPHAVGSGPESRPRDALARRMRPARQAGHHDPHRAARSALSVGRQEALRRTAQEVLERGRHRHRARISSKPNSPSATSATCARAKAAISSSPTSRKARAACATCRRSTGSANISITSTTRPISSSTTSSRRDEYKTFQKAEAFLWDVRVPAALSRRPRGRAPVASTCSPNSPRAWASPTTIRAAPSKHFMRAYFLVAKDVGDLTRIFCAALEEQNRKRRPLAVAPPARLSQAARRQRRFLRRERPAQRARRRVPARSRQPHPHLPRRRRERRRRPSRRAAHDHALARPHHRRRAQRSRRQPAVPRHPVVAARSRAGAAPDERSRRVRPLRAGIRPRRRR